MTIQRTPLPKMPARAALIPILLGAGLAILVAVLTGCASNFGIHAINCSGGKCVTTNASVGAGKSSLAPASTSAAPEVTVTQTETPTQTAEPVVTATPVSVGPCNVYLTGDEMQQLASSEAARQNLMDCMQIPDGTQRDQMDNWLAQHALDEINSTPGGRRHWEEHQLTGAYRQYS